LAACIECAETDASTLCAALCADTSFLPLPRRHGLISQVSVLLFWQYLASLITLPLAIAAMLKLLTPLAANPAAWAAAPAASVRLA
jgi:hypothetical protein